MIGYVLIWACFGVAAAVVASSRGGNTLLWFIGGMIFGPLAFVCAFFVGKPCPSCHSRIHSGATICPKCQSDLSSNKEFGKGSRGASSSSVIALGALVVLIGIYLIMQQSEKSSLSVKVNDNFLDVDSGMVNKITVQRLGTFAEFQQVGEDWTVLDRGKSYPCEKGTIQQLAALAHTLSVGEVISSNPEKQMLFQVDTIIGNRVTFFRDANELASVVIGKVGADYQSTYVRKPGSNDVYVAKGNFARLLNRPASGYRDKTLLTVDTTQIATISVKSKDFDYRIGRQDSLWRLVPAKGDPFTVKPEKMSNLLRQLAVVRWNNTPPEADTVRPDFLQPSVAVDVAMLDGSNRSLRFVEHGTENKTYYTQSPAGDETFVVYEYVITNLAKKPEDLK